MARASRFSGKRDEKALSEVIGFILLLGVVVAAFSLWMIYIVPANGREAEITHMNSVKDRFTDYKFSLDSLWINNQTDKRGVLVSTSFDLGTPGGNTQAGGLFLPLLNPIASSATFSVKDPGDTLTITSSENSSSSLLDYSTNMTTLQYQSQNYYWIQQNYTYQLGGVFLGQADGATARISPDLSIFPGQSNTIGIDITVIQLHGGGSIGGNGPVRVDTQLRSPTPSNIATATQTYALPANWVNISVSSSDNLTAQAWWGVFRDAAARQNVTDLNIIPPNWDPAKKRATVLINIVGPDKTTGPSSLKDVFLKVRNADYEVWINNIA